VEIIKAIVDYVGLFNRCLREAACEDSGYKGSLRKRKKLEGVDLIVRMGEELPDLVHELYLEFKIGESGDILLTCIKALQGHIKAARLFYDDLNATLTMKMSFTSNRYDPCIYNKETKDGYVTICMHVMI
jgi:hypothetical protein